MATARANWRFELSGATPRTQVQEILAKYNPGVEPQIFVDDHSAKLIPKGSDIVFETHYTTIGKPATDRSRIGLALAKAAPERALHYRSRHRQWKLGDSRGRQQF